MGYYNLHGCSFSIFLDRERDELVLMSLQTTPSQRGKGLAKKALRAARKCSERFGKDVVLFVGAFNDRPLSNDALERLYHRMGFRVYEHNPYTGYTWMKFSPIKG